MNIFKPTTFTWGQLGELKWATVLIGIAIGATWSHIFAPYVLVLVVLGVLFSVPPAIAWFREHNTGSAK